jgi:enoyl-CoA hydratase
VALSAGSDGTQVHQWDDGPVRVVEIRRPHRRNAVDRETADLLAAAFRTFDEEEGASVAVLHGAGGTFCAGADLHAIAAGQPNRISADGDGPMGPSRLLLGKPVIAAIEGHAVAGGLELACWCDLRVAARDATLGVFCRRLGVPLIDGGTLRLPQILGLGRAMELVLSGRAIQAPEAYAWGLVNRVVEPGEALGEAVRWAQELARLPQASLRSDRASLLTNLGRPPELAFPDELQRGVGSLGEGVAGARGFVDGLGRHGEVVNPNQERRRETPAMFLRTAVQKSR